ncbi:four-carbon acid sugar kinase family protein [Desertivirga xinjiangensis]|uniref:four-carbon acid sugar kinase family protein n=1 Tax=Desertivirga xinjiangensis TaxID=539206 RepID=UPI00210AE0B5|nr:four-carbon acid sugar kinase family protein [Pedobacter xinjiangensis]
MIAVIADDLTGAAELGGIALSYGLSVEITTEIAGISLPVGVDLLVVAADTRSKPLDDALADMMQITRQIIGLRPEFIFKKVDSVLRGYVADEIMAQLRVLGYERALLVPANPDLGRTIEEGIYYIQGKPIAESGFSQDPEFPARSSDVLRLVGAKGTVSVKKHTQSLPEKGIVIGEAALASDLDDWAKVPHEETLLAGASGFFKALLRRSGFFRNESLQNHDQPGSNKLFVCGSAFASSNENVKRVFQSGGPVSYMPASLMSYPEREDELEIWTTEISNLIAEHGTAVIAIQPGLKGSANAVQLRKIMSDVVKQVFKSVSINELIIEGGSTASSVLNQLSITVLRPVYEYSTGVIRTKVSGFENLYVTLKPGSYNWPAQVWALSGAEEQN